MDWVQFGVSLAGTVLLVGIAWGAETSKRAAIEKQLTAANVEIENIKNDRLHSIQTIADLKAKAEHHAITISELKQTKASVELVDGLREAIGRIDGKLDALLRQGRNQGTGGA
jgi:hypothetical protein